MKSWLQQVGSSCCGCVTFNTSGLIPRIKSKNNKPCENVASSRRSSGFADLNHASQTFTQSIFKDVESAALISCRVVA